MGIIKSSADFKINTNNNDKNSKTRLLIRGDRGGAVDNGIKALPRLITKEYVPSSGIFPQDGRDWWQK